MGTFLFLAYDADHAGRLIGQARLKDDPDELRQISNVIDSGNQLWSSWAVNNSGSNISCGGDEGIITVPAAALNDLAQIKDQYQNLLNLTVSIGIGMKMSEAFKALMSAKLRGRNRTVFFDKEVNEEIQKVADSDNDEAKKIVDEYLNKSEVLAKRQPIHHVGKGGNQTTPLPAPKNPEMQQKETLKDMPDPPKSKMAHLESSFRSMASATQKKEDAAKTQKSASYQDLKQKIAVALQGIQKQLPQLAEIKQAAPETYAAILALVKGVITLGQELKTTDDKLSKAIGQVDIWHNQLLPPTGMLSTSTGGLENYDLGMDKSDMLPGGLADKNTPSQFDQEQLAVGTQIELEHTKDESIAREIAMDHLKEDPNYYKAKSVEKSCISDQKEELNPNQDLPSNKVLDKSTIPEHIKSIKAKGNLVPGQALDGRHIVVRNASGNNVVRQVAAGMQRDLNDTAGTPTGPGMGNPTSTRNKPSQT